MARGRREHFKGGQGRDPMIVLLERVAPLVVLALWVGMILLWLLGVLLGEPWR